MATMKALRDMQNQGYTEGFAGHSATIYSLGENDIFGNFYTRGYKKGIKEYKQNQMHKLLGLSESDSKPL